MCINLYMFVDVYVKNLCMVVIDFTPLKSNLDSTITFDIYFVRVLNFYKKKSWKTIKNIEKQELDKEWIYVLIV